MSCYCPIRTDIMGQKVTGGRVPIMANPIWNEKKQKWILRIYDSGRVIKEFTSSKKGAAGARECNQRRSEYLGGYAEGNENITVSAEWSRFFKDVEIRYSPEGARNIESYGRNNILPVIGSRRLRSLTTNDLQLVLNSAKKQSGELLSLKSLKNIKAVINSFLKFCKRDGYTVPDSSDIYLPIKKAAEKKEKIVLTEEQIARLFDDSQPYADLWYIDYFRFLCATGCRPGEALALTYDDYDGTFISITKSINIEGRLTKGKTANAHRRFALNSRAKAAIESQIAKTKKFGSKYIFCNTQGELMNERTALTRWKYITEPSRLNAPGTSLYSLRHTFISHSAPILSEPILKSIVGHSVNMDTYGVYNHSTDKQLIIAAEALDKVFS